VQNGIPLEVPLEEAAWSLVEIADAIHASYDFVYRDVRHGILPCHSLPLAQRHDRQRFAVTLSDLARAARPCYRRLAVAWARSRPPHLAG
jgi:hypothetical protein